jgi:hypothetical protein
MLKTAVGGVFLSEIGILSALLSVSRMIIKFEIAVGLLLVASVLQLVASYEELPAETFMAGLAKDHEAQERTEMVRQEVLNFIARKKAEDMAARGFFSHVNPDGYGPNFAAHQAGYALAFGSSPQSNSIESIGARHQNGLAPASAAKIVFDSWLESPGHRRHVLGEVDQFRNQTAYGIGYAFAATGPFGWSSHYFVFVSANLDADAQVSPFVEWKFETMSLVEMDHPEEDADADGRNFLWEYSLNSSPKIADEERTFAFDFDSDQKQGVISLALRENLDPAVDVIVETSDLTRGNAWSRDDVTRSGNEFRAGMESDLLRIFRVRLKHSQFSRLPRR